MFFLFKKATENSIKIYVYIVSLEESWFQLNNFQLLHNYNQIDHTKVENS